MAVRQNLPKRITIRLDQGLYLEVKAYCRRNEITISEMIRSCILDELVAEVEYR